MRRARIASAYILYVNATPDADRRAMINEVDNIISQYDRGTLSRRQLMTALLALAASPAAAAQAPKAVKPALNLNHVHLYIADLDREIKFYKDLLGAEVHDTSPGNATMHLPGKPAWISLTVTKEKPYINHVGYGVDFDQKGG